MSSNPMGTSGGNYPPPAIDFSRYAGSSFPPPGTNYYPTNPSMSFTNPYQGSSIGAYPNATFPPGMAPSFQPNFTSSSYPGSVTPSGIPSYTQPPPSFNPNLPQGRPSGVNPPITPPGSIPAWVAAMQPSSMVNPPSSDYRINNTPSMPSFASQPFIPTMPSFQSVDSFLLRNVGSQAVFSSSNYIGAVSFSTQLPSGRAGLPSTYSSLVGASFLPSRGDSWTPPSSSSRRDFSNSDRAVVQWTPGHLSSYGQTLPSVDRDSQFQFTMLRKFEETASFMYQMHASPERPFARWDTMVVAPVAIQINPQMTLFVDPFNISEFFQRVTARAQEINTSQEDPSASLGQTIAIMRSTETHGWAKYVGIFLKNTLLTIQQLNPNPRRLHLTDKSLSEAWETEAVPAIQQSIDNAYGTNIGANYNPNNDGRMQQAVQNFVLDPLWFFPMGRLVEGVNLTLRGATVTIKEIGSAFKTARVALEAPGAMKPAFAIAGSSAMAKETKAAGVFVSELKAGSRAASLESKAVSDAGKMVKTEEAATMAGRQVVALENSAGAQVIQLEKRVSEWLGEDTQLMRNKSGDPVFLSKDGFRKVRFDFNKPHPHQSPHLHFEHLVDGEWQELNRVYPIDVPHK